MNSMIWLLRNVSQPSAIHDLLWSFITSLEDKSDGNNSNELNEHPTSDIYIGGQSINPLPTTFHTLLQTISDLMLLLPAGSALQQIAVRCWSFKFKPSDHQFLHQSHVFR